jgi:predicted PurR-regulated permease PerM
MTTAPIAASASRADITTWVAAAIALVLVIELHLLSALLAGLLVFKLVDVITPRLRVGTLGHDTTRALAVTLIATLVIALLVGLGLGLATLLRHSGESFPTLMQRMAQIIEEARERMPEALRGYFPDDASSLQATLSEWLRSNAGTLQLAGRGITRSVVHVLMGMIIGALLSMQKVTRAADHRPLTQLIMGQASQLATAFQRVVFAQVWISLINTLATWVYLDLVLPGFGIDVPLVKSLILLTFFIGLLPIIGNLLSNSAIVIVCLSLGLPVAVASLVFLIVIHKLEYFLNARIVGSHINARAWELLVAMLFMEAAFGITGLIAAPIFYAYFKEELREKGLV